MAGPATERTRAVGGCRVPVDILSGTACADFEGTQRNGDSAGSGRLVRWPILGDYLAAHPESIPSLIEAGPDAAWPTAELQALAHDPDVRTVVAFPAGTTLTPELIRTCCGETYQESSELRVP